MFAPLQRLVTDSRREEIAHLVKLQSKDEKMINKGEMKKESACSECH
jgi:hypothetical protein